MESNGHTPVEGLCQPLILTGSKQLSGGSSSSTLISLRVMFDVCKSGIVAVKANKRCVCRAGMFMG